MHFLCLHGTGANGKIFEMQTAAIRYGLGPEHTYEFIDGAYPAEIAAGLESLSTPSSETLSYHLPIAADSGASARQALTDLEELVAREGPFDGVMGFSHGAALAATLMARVRHATGRSPFRCAVFFCGGEPVDVRGGEGAWAAVLAGEAAAPRAMSKAVDGEVIAIPTTHVWGERDTLYPTYGWRLRDLCEEGVRSEFVHGGGHEIPGARDPVAVQRAVLAVKRSIARAESLGRAGEGRG